MILEKMQRINQLVQNTVSESVNFMEVASILSEVLQANVYVVDEQGEILGYGMAEYALTAEWEHIMNVDKRFPEKFNRALLELNRLSANIQDKSAFLVFSEEENRVFQEKCITVSPIIGGGKRIGTLVCARENRQFAEDDLVMIEYSTTIVAMEILRQKHEMQQEQMKQRMMASLAVDALSFSESIAIKRIFEVIEEDEGIVVASQIADRDNLTRSVFVNALRKLQSAGVIESRSLGMKGTFIKIINPYIREQIQKTS
jgi:transcriptional pleiotropic repressor